MRIELTHMGCPVGGYIHIPRWRDGHVPASSYRLTVVDGERRSMPTEVWPVALRKGHRFNRRKRIAEHIRMMRLLHRRGDFDPPPRIIIT